MHRAKVQGRALISAHIHASNAEGASYGYRCSYRTDAAAFADLATTAATVGLLLLVRRPPKFPSLSFTLLMLSPLLLIRSARSVRLLLPPPSGCVANVATSAASQKCKPWP
jgi:hypothetical protein